jgi:hypothetical protein
MLGRVVGRSVHDQSGRCCLLDLSVLYTQGYCAPVPVVGAFAHVKTGPPLLFIRSVYTDCNGGVTNTYVRLLFGGWRFLFIFAWIESLQDLIIRSRRDSTSDSKALQLMDKVARV